MDPAVRTNYLPKCDELLMLPLGGSGEIGMNMTLYGFDGNWIMIDAGITFADEDYPDYDVLMADPAFIEARRDHLAGIVLTHGHEDHIGALPYLWRRLGCPIYATPFTAALVQQKMRRAGIGGVPLIEVPLGGRFDLGGFTIEYIGMTHSIPEPNALLMETPLGNVLHTGDWKLDPDPVIGDTFDSARLMALREPSLLAMVCDSTNAVVSGTTGSEGDLFAPLCDIAEQAEGRLVVTTFASNVARLVTLARVAAAVGRRFGVIGQAMERMLAVARSSGYWPEDLPDLVDAGHLAYLPAQEVFAVCTGSQGEPSAALAKMADDRHRDLSLAPGDTVVFSSRLIPGNERAVQRVEQRLRDFGVQVVTDADAAIHVSGHPARDDLKQLFDWVRPRCLIPVHGTPRHLQANLDIARDSGVPQRQIVLNGEICRLGTAKPAVVAQVENGRVCVDDQGTLQKVPADLLLQMRGHTR